MICPNCGMDANANFCPNCGTPLNIRGNNPQVNNPQGNNPQGNNGFYPNNGYFQQQPQWNNAMPIEQKKSSGISGGAVLGIFFAVILVVSVICISVFGVSSSNSSNNPSSSSSDSLHSTSSSVADEDESSDTDKPLNVFDFPDTSEVSEPDPVLQKPMVDKEEFIASCSDLLPDYKNIARNPDNYLGQNFYITCYVSDVREGGLLSGYQKYYITYAFDFGEAEEAIDFGFADDYSDAWLWGCDMDKEVWIMDNRDTSDSEYIKVLEGDIVTIYGTFSGLTATQNSITNESGEVVSLDIVYVDIIEE